MRYVFHVLHSLPHLSMSVSVLLLICIIFFYYLSCQIHYFYYFDSYNNITNDTTLDQASWRTRNVHIKFKTCVTWIDVNDIQTTGGITSYIFKMTHAAKLVIAYRLTIFHYYYFVLRLNYSVLTMQWGIKLSLDKIQRRFRFQNIEHSELFHV